MDESKQMNPDIITFIYGKKELNELTLYPLSIGDQFKVTSIVTEVVKELVEGSAGGKLNDFVFMTAAMKALENNLGKILSLVADIPEIESKEVISKLTNIQLIDIIEKIWSTNYEPALKKGQDLFDRGRQLFASRRSSLSSSNTIPNTDLKTSIESPISQEE